MKERKTTYELRDRLCSDAMPVDRVVDRVG